MARPEKKSMVVNVSAGQPGAAIEVFQFRDKLVTFSGAFIGDFNVQGSVDGTGFIDIGAAVTTTPTFLEIPQTVQFLRIFTTAFTSAPTVSFTGFDDRTDT